MITVQISSNYKGYFRFFVEWEFSLDERSIRLDKRKITFDKKIIFIIMFCISILVLKKRTQIKQYDLCPSKKRLSQKSNFSFYECFFYFDRKNSTIEKTTRKALL